MDASLQSKNTGESGFLNSFIPSRESLKKWRFRLRRRVSFPLKLFCTAMCILLIQVLGIGTLDLLFGIPPQIVFVISNFLIGTFFIASLLLSRRVAGRLSVTAETDNQAKRIVSSNSPICKILFIQRRDVQTNLNFRQKDDYENL